MAKQGDRCTKPRCRKRPTYLVARHAFQGEPEDPGGKYCDEHTMEEAETLQKRGHAVDIIPLP